MRKIKIITTGVIAAAVIAIPSTAFAYDVQPGDTLSGIAERHGYESYHQLAKENGVKNPDLILVGQHLDTDKKVERKSSHTSRSAPRTVVPKKKPSPTPVVPAAPEVSNRSVWDAVAQCESTGNWSINSGNGFYGGLQHTASTWAAFGGTAYAPRADLASKAAQIATAEKVLAVQGPGAWPRCSVVAGLK